MLDRAADLALHLAEHLADAPERLGLFQAVGDRGVSHQTALDALVEDLLHGVAQAGARLRGQLDQHVPGMRVVQRVAAAGRILQHRLDAVPQHQLERRDIAAGAFARDAEQLERGFRRGTPTNAVSTERGRGIMRSIAAVMMPSVPSAPMNRFFRS